MGSQWRAHERAMKSGAVVLSPGGKAHTFKDAKTFINGLDHPGAKHEAVQKLEQHKRWLDEAKSVTTEQHLKGALNAWKSNSNDDTWKADKNPYVNSARFNALHTELAHNGKFNPVDLFHGTSGSFAQRNAYRTRMSSWSESEGIANHHIRGAQWGSDPSTIIQAPAKSLYGLKLDDYIPEHPLSWEQEWVAAPTGGWQKI